MLPAGAEGARVPRWQSREPGHARWWIVVSEEDKRTFELPCRGIIISTAMKIKIGSWADYDFDKEDAKIAVP